MKSQHLKKDKWRGRGGGERSKPWKEIEGRDAGKGGLGKETVVLACSQKGAKKITEPAEGKGSDKDAGILSKGCGSYHFPSFPQTRIPPSILPPP